MLACSLAEDYNIFEVVDDNFKFTGKQSKIAKVLVTSFCNRILPLLRYAIDDILEIEEPNEALYGSRYRILKTVHGRADDAFVYTGNIKTHPMVFRHILGQKSLINEYQVIQSKNGADISIISAGNINISKIKKDLEKSLIDSGLKNLQVRLSLSDKLISHSETGKTRRFISLKNTEKRLDVVRGTIYFSSFLRLRALHFLLLRLLGIYTYQNLRHHLWTL